MCRCSAWVRARSLAVLPVCAPPTTPMHAPDICQAGVVSLYTGASSLPFNSSVLLVCRHSTANVGRQVACRAAYVSSAPPAMVPAPEPHELSGQHGTRHSGEPKTGVSCPLGAHFNRDLVCQFHMPVLPSPALGRPTYNLCIHTAHTTLAWYENINKSPMPAKSMCRMPITLPYTPAQHPVSRWCCFHAATLMAAGPQKRSSWTLYSTALATSGTSRCRTSQRTFCTVRRTQQLCCTLSKIVYRPSCRADPVAESPRNGVWCWQRCICVLHAGYRVGGAHEGTKQEAAAAGIRHDESKVLLDPYATNVISRGHWGERGNDRLDYGRDDVLGLADTWPQAASPVPDPHARHFDWQVCWCC